MEGILLNKKAAFVTVYKDIYSSVVSEISEDCVLYDHHEVCQFLASNRQPVNSLIDRLDPYRDNFMSTRMGKIIKSEMHRNQ